MAIVSPTIWYGNENNLIYASYQKDDTLVASGDDVGFSFGLTDFTELPATSHMFLNRIRFHIKVWTIPGGLSYVEGSWIGLICPRDLAGNSFSDLNDAQDYYAWPLRDMYGFTLNQGDPTSTQPAVSQTTMTKTYSPRKSLVLNREQIIYFNWHHESGPDVQLSMNMTAEFKRATGSK